MRLIINPQGFRTRVVDLQEATVETMKDDHLAVFLTATYGEGEPTDNARDFFNWLKDADDKGTEYNKFLGLNYCVFGLGSTDYENFNRVGTFIDKRMSDLGATRVMDLVRGNDAMDIEADFAHWRETLWPTLTAKFIPTADEGSGLAGGTTSASLRQIAFNTKVCLKFKCLAAKAQGRRQSAFPNAQINNSTKYFFTSPKARRVGGCTTYLTSNQPTNQPSNPSSSAFLKPLFPLHLSFILPGIGPRHQNEGAPAIHCGRIHVARGARRQRRRCTRSTLSFTLPTGNNCIALRLPIRSDCP